MAERRMFHTAVVESDAFLDLPAGVQALYFHLGMQADDDGFVNGPRQIARKLGVSPEALGLLTHAGFLLEFDGIVVIKHWRMANSWKSDRLQLPRYPEIAKLLYLKDTKAYTLTREKGLQNLLQIKKKCIKDFGIRTESQKRREENKKEEKKRKENRIEELRREDMGFPEGDPEEVFVYDTAATDRDMNYMKGKLGKGVVLLSAEQIEELLNRMGLDSFDYYVEKLADFILQKHCMVKNHYATILKWWQEDRGIAV